MKNLRAFFKNFIIEKDGSKKIDLHFSLLFFLVLIVIFFVLKSVIDKI